VKRSGSRRPPIIPVPRARASIRFAHPSGDAAVRAVPRSSDVHDIECSTTRRGSRSAGPTRACRPAASDPTSGCPPRSGFVELDHADQRLVTARTPRSAGCTSSTRRSPWSSCTNGLPSPPRPQRAGPAPCGPPEHPPRPARFGVPPLRIAPPPTRSCPSVSEPGSSAPKRSALLRPPRGSRGRSWSPSAVGRWPLSYPSGTIAEHRACRTASAMFDVSHLGTVRVEGPRRVRRAPAHAEPNDLAAIAPGRAQYTHLLEEDGSVLDDK